MGRFTQRLIRFFYGRYGNDQLNRFLGWASALLFLLSFLLRLFLPTVPGFWVSLGMNAAAILLLSWCFFRGLSRNIPKRTRENLRFAALRTTLSRPLRRMRARFRDRKTHIFRKCPGCKKTLRLPRTPGNHTVCCPLCSRRFSVKIKK